MKTWWQRKTVGIEVVMMWVLGILVVSVFVLWAMAGWGQTGCVMQTFILPDGRMVVCQVCPGLTTCF